MSSRPLPEMNSAPRRKTEKLEEIEGGASDCDGPAIKESWESRETRIDSKDTNKPDEKRLIGKFSIFDLKNGTKENSKTETAAG